MEELKKLPIGWFKLEEVEKAWKGWNDAWNRTGLNSHGRTYPPSEGHRRYLPEPRGAIESAGLDRYTQDFIEQVGDLRHVERDVLLQYPTQRDMEGVWIRGNGVDKLLEEGRLTLMPPRNDLYMLPRIEVPEDLIGRCQEAKDFEGDGYAPLVIQDADEAAVIMKEIRRTHKCYHYTSKEEVSSYLGPAAYLCYLLTREDKYISLPDKYAAHRFLDNVGHLGFPIAVDAIFPTQDGVAYVFAGRGFE